MKKFLLSLVVALSLTACASCAKKQQVSTNEPVPSCDGGSCPMPAPKVTPPAPQPPTNVPDVIAKDNWQFTLTGPGWAPVTSPDPQIQVVMKNQDQKLMVFLVKEESHDAFPVYVLNTLRAIRSSGVDITSAKQVVLNGDPYVLVQATTDGNALYAWITAKGGFGYAFSCGGPVNVDAGIAPCDAIAQTLQIK